MWRGVPSQELRRLDLLLVCSGHVHVGLDSLSLSGGGVLVTACVADVQADDSSL